ncbi:MAG: DHH family phosphoesterase [Desulfovibrionaceae bacterium]|nr:DHH family phosphoesterase [Desulfovibrionaceae bacterium]
MKWQELLGIIGGERLFIQTHDYPDPDAIASAFGLQAFLAHFGIHSLLCYSGEAERISVTTAIEAFNIPIFHFSDSLCMQSEDRIILVDGQKFNANMSDLPGTVIACIDHHPIRREPSYAFTDIRQVGSCSSIIADYFLSAKIPLPRDVATMLLYGLHVDTGYMTRGVQDLDLDIFPMLYRASDQESLERVESRNLEFADLKAFGAAINSITIFDRTGFAYIPFSCPDALIAQVANFILSLAEVDVAIISSSRPNGIKYSVRSVMTGLHSGSMLAELMPPYGSGGGHAGMAGGFVRKEAIIENGMDEEQVMNLLKEHFLTYISQHAQKNT